MQPLPAVVKVGFRDYPIEAYDQRIAFKDKAWGHTDHDPPLIRIDAGATVQQQATSLLHEILHAIYAVYQPPYRAKNEEDLVNPLANALASVWRDNPDVVQWIMDGLK